MSLSITGISLVGSAAAVSAVLAGATVWLLLTNPVSVADAIGQGDPAPLVRLLADALLGAVRTLLTYL
jgi:hypothetical protein